MDRRYRCRSRGRRAFVTFARDVTSLVPAPSCRGCAAMPREASRRRLRQVARCRQPIAGGARPVRAWRKKVSYRTARNELLAPFKLLSVVRAKSALTKVHLRLQMPAHMQMHMHRETCKEIVKPMLTMGAPGRARTDTADPFRGPASALGLRGRPNNNSILLSVGQQRIF